MVMQFESTDISYGDSPVSGTLGPGERSQTLPCARAVPRVLVADNDESLRDLIADVFAFEGYFVTEAKDDVSVFQCVHGVPGYPAEQFDLLVLGFQSRGALGIDTLTKLRNSGCRTPVIVLASRSQSELVPHLNELDALFLSKPFALENLRVLANHVIRAYQYGFSQVSPSALTLTNSGQGSIDTCDPPPPQQKAV
jgi:two-component system alkaline phosphatase synthesis response regulator PhoP